MICSSPNRLPFIRPSPFRDGLYLISAEFSGCRPQALGFTVAELFTLLLFLVLLILAAVEQHEKSTARAVEEKWDQVQKKLQDANKKAAVLAERDKRLRNYFGVADDFGDNFSDLVPSKSGRADRQTQQALKEKAEAADEINGLLNGSASSTQNQGERGSKYNPKSLPGQVKSCIDEKQRLQGQLANVEKHGGRGAVFPPCWVTPNGGTEFVFDVDLQSSPDGGLLVIHDNQVPGHNDEKARLSSDVQVNHPLTDSDFLDETRQFYDFGTKQQPECRFFVRVNDRTAQQDKSTFKELLLTVEKNFYKAWGQGE
jgi:hypothetical protein